MMLIGISISCLYLYEGNKRNLSICLESSFRLSQLKVTKMLLQMKSSANSKPTSATGLHSTPPCHQTSNTEERQPKEFKMPDMKGLQMITKVATTNILSMREAKVMLNQGSQLERLHWRVRLSHSQNIRSSV